MQVVLQLDDAPVDRLKATEQRDAIAGELVQVDGVATSELACSFRWRNM